MLLKGGHKSDSSELHAIGYHPFLKLSSLPSCRTIQNVHRLQALPIIRQPMLIGKPHAFPSSHSSPSIELSHVDQNVYRLAALPVIRQPSDPD